MKKLQFVADFETTTDPDDCRVWAWATCNINDFATNVGTTLKTFLRFISSVDSETYFHNLAFDGSFILDHILKSGYTYTPEKPRKGEFTTLIDNNGKHYSIEICWQNGHRTEFRDSMKKLPMSVARIAKAFKLPVSKLTIDYTAYRSPTHELTPDETEYVKADVVIVAMALRQQFDAGMTHLTVGSDSLAEYKRTYRKFKHMFPTLEKDIDDAVRKAYRGGFTYADSRTRGQVVGAGRVYDVNSLYPSVMYDRLLPYGVPVWREGWPEFDPDFPLFITKVTFTGRVKPDHIPCIQIHGSSYFVPAEYQTVIDKPVTLSCSSIDLALWQDQYDLDILEMSGAWYFKGQKGFFTEYIDKWMEVKRNSEGGMREIAKLHLNSLYGKFATNPDVSGKYPTLDNDVVKLVYGPDEYRDPVYTPMGVFITAYARDVTIRAAQQHYDVFAYCDTDSLHLLVNSDPATLDIDPSRLGAWKHELTFDSALFARAKCYTEYVSGECTCRHDPHMRGCGFHTHVAGLPSPAAALLEFDDFVDGKHFSGKLLPRRVSGGIVLVDAGYTLRL